MNERIRIRITARERTAIERAARLRGVGTSAYGREVIRRVLGRVSVSGAASRDAGIEVELTGGQAERLRELASASGVEPPLLARLVVSAAATGPDEGLVQQALTAAREPVQKELPEGWTHPRTWKIADSAVESWIEAGGRASARARRGQGHDVKEMARDQLPSLVERVVFTAEGEWRDPISFDGAGRAMWRGTRRAGQARMVVEPGDPTVVLWVGTGVPPRWCWTMGGP